MLFYNLYKQIAINESRDGIYHKAYDQLQQKYGADTIIDTYFFECDGVAARRNVVYRDDGRDVEGTVRRFEKIYKPPTVARKIWRAN